MSDGTRRDPRTDPRPTDEVGNRRVEYVTVLGTVVYGRNNREHRCSLDAWRRWARDKEVRRRATLPVCDGIYRELNWLRNRLQALHSMHADAELLTALAELALASLHHHTRPAPPLSLEDVRRVMKMKMKERREAKKGGLAPLPGANPFRDTVETSPGAL